MMESAHRRCKAARKKMPRMRTLVYHLPCPGLGHFVKRGDRFHFEPEP
jgi:hypothetical protein